MSKSRKRRADQPRQGWFTKDEAAQIDALAETHGGFADLVRAAVLGYKPPASKLDAPALTRLRAEIAKLRGELGKHGSNLNQLVEYLHTGRPVDRLAGLLTECLELLAEAYREIAEWRTIVMQAMGQERPQRPTGDDPD